MGVSALLLEQAQAKAFWAKLAHGASKLHFAPGKNPSGFFEYPPPVRNRHGYQTTDSPRLLGRCDELHRAT